MKKTILSLLAVIACLQSFAQSPVGGNAPDPEKATAGRRRESHAPLYINLSTGLNSNAGIIGLGLEIPVSDHISLEGGLGISSWGYKAYACGKYYIHPDFKGWAFGPGITYNSGLDRFTTNLETAYGSTETVELHLDPQANLFLAAYRNWRLGRQSNRIFLQLGLSMPVTGVSFWQTGGTPISRNAESVTRFIAPGGLIVAVGFSFGAGGHKDAAERR